MDIEKACTQFLQYTQNKGAAPGTIEYYGMGLRLFRLFLQDRLISDVTAITFGVLQDYIEHTRTRPKMDRKPGSPATSTVNTHIKAIRGLFKYLLVVGSIAENPAEKIAYLRNRYAIINSLTEEHIAKLLAVIQKDTFVGKRNRLLIHLLLDCGLRISEALGTTVSSFDMDKLLVKVTGKGNKERVIPFGQSFKKKLLKWVAENSLLISDHIFFTGSGRMVTTSIVRNQFREYGKKAEITGAIVRPHVFRHTFALYFLRNGGNPLILQRLLGHTTLYMTMRYVNLQTEDLSREHQRCGPGDRLFQNDDDNQE